MKLLPILTALALGASAGSAFAEPDRPLDAYDRSTYGRYHRDRGWVTLTAPLANFNNREFIRIGRDQGRFERLRLDVEAGRVYVRQVLINFADGTSQKLLLNRFLRAGEHIQIDVPGRARAINRLVVYTDPARSRRTRGEYRISGVPARSQYGYGDRYRGRGDYRRR
jgi:hypothetical protein